MINCDWLLSSQLGGPIFGGLRRAFGARRRVKPAADQRAGRVSVDPADRQSAATQPLAPRLSLAGPSAQPTIPLAYPATPETSAGQPAEVVAGEAERTATVLQRVVGQPGGPDQVGQQLGDIAADLVRRARAGADWTIRRAADRAISPNSVTGISLLLGLCAAAWFSGGSHQDDVRGLITTGAWVVVRAGARKLASVTEKARARAFGWFYVVCATAAECAIYGGIAAGAESAGWTSTWPLAVAIVATGSVTVIARACGDAAVPTDRTGGPATRWWDALATRLRYPHSPVTFPPIGVRLLLTALILVGYGPRIALVSVLAIAAVSGVRNLIRTGGRMAAGRRVAAQDVVLACRDDGPIARRAGRLVRGNLMPVPPAVAGLVAIVLLAALGIKNLPGIVALTPVVVMLLAAPGSSHPHDGRFDWLVPVLLCLAQYLYLTALGAAKSVSWLLMFATCSMTAVWYASLVASRVPDAPDTRTPTRRKARVSQIMARRADGIGWEGRIGIAGLAGMLGIATFGYLGLTVWLGVLLGRKAFIEYLRQGEDQRR